MDKDSSVPKLNSAVLKDKEDGIFYIEYFTYFL